MVPSLLALLFPSYPSPSPTLTGFSLGQPNSGPLHHGLLVYFPNSKHGTLVKVDAEQFVKLIYWRGSLSVSVMCYDKEPHSSEIVNYNHTAWLLTPWVAGLSPDLLEEASPRQQVNLHIPDSFLGASSDQGPMPGTIPPNPSLLSEFPAPPQASSSTSTALLEVSMSAHVQNLRISHVLHQEH